MNPPCSNNEWTYAFFDSMAGAEEAAGSASADVLPRYTDHSYHDFSTYIEDGGKIKKHKKSERNFPARLHTILSDEKYAHIISWMVSCCSANSRFHLLMSSLTFKYPPSLLFYFYQPHGRAWKVIDKSLLVDEVIPKFFGQSKFASFTRQLSGWGFKRLHQTGRDFGCYYHECFLRGHPRLTVLMRRTSPGKGKATPSMNTEPDFYAIAEQYPLHATGEKQVFTPEFESKRKKRKSESKPMVNEPTAPKTETSSIDPLPISSCDNLEPIALPSKLEALLENYSVEPIALPSSSSSDSCVNQIQGNNGNQYFGNTTPSMFIDQYQAGGGNLYQNVQTRSQPQTTAMAPAPICAEDGLCSMNVSSCFGNGQHQHQQHSVGNIAPYPYPTHAQSLYGPSSFSRNNSLGYGGMNIYSQHQSHPSYFQQQGQAQGLGQPAYCSTSASTRNNYPKKRFSLNAWDDTAATKDSLKEMPMSIPEKGFDFNVSSIEDSFRNSYVDTATTSLG